MEMVEYMGTKKQDSKVLLPLFHYITSNVVAGFDNVEYNGSSIHPYQPTLSATTVPLPNLKLAKGMEVPGHVKNSVSSASCLPNSSAQAVDFHRSHSISISMPSSPAGLHFDQSNRVFFSISDSGTPNRPARYSNSNTKQPKQVKFHSQPMTSSSGRFPNSSERQHRDSQNDKQKDQCYNTFKTWSGKLERQLSHLHGKQEPEPMISDSQNTESEVLPVDRYFDALGGPELETLRPSEELVLPKDKEWPFLLRFPISSFGICLGLSSQAILWKALSTTPSTGFLHITPTINVVLWFISVVVTAIVAFMYSLKLFFYFEAVRREYYHPVRINFFFAPWIALLFLALGVPSLVAKNLHPALWYWLMAPILCLELKIYGQWMSGGERRLSRVANPSNHLSIVGNFVGALLGASMGLKEGPIFFFAVGLAHYIVLFVTLYQRLPTNETLPKELHPVFFLFVAAPSVASMAWARIQGDYGYGSRIAYFIALFLYFSLAVRINFFRGFRFSLAWWAYTFPMTGASVATIKYSNEVKNPLTQALSVSLSAISTLTVAALLVSTVVHAFVHRNLFPNDIAIAIAEGRTKGNRKCSYIESETSDSQDAENSTERDSHIV